eukprot:Lithocolla_globosa_v1_NODE_2792_length_1867_cov_4.489514.p2 type:complete len:113 gc:universal NODE_2792_length_1867_cov_4.489514:1178-1516(+)
MTGNATTVRSCAMRSNMGSSHPSLHSQWLSIYTSTSPFACRAPSTFARINPTRSGIRISLTLSNFLISASNRLPRCSIVLESSTKMISWSKCDRVRSRTLWTVRRRVVRASL